jgi:hypothetical protein
VGQILRRFSCDSSKVSNILVRRNDKHLYYRYKESKITSRFASKFVKIKVKENNFVAM